MPNKTEIADLYALREFLQRHYSSSRRFLDESRALDFFKDKYFFTPPSNGENPSFSLRRTKFVKHYDLMDFVYGNAEIKIVSKETRNNLDIQMLSSLVELLNSKPYKELISIPED